MVDDELGFLVADREATALEGPLLCTLAPHVDGESSLAELADRLDGRLDALDVWYGLSLLEQRGCLADPELPEDHDPAALPDLIPWGGAASAAPLESAQVSVHPSGLSISDQHVATLADAGVAIRDGAEFTLALTDDYQHPDLDEINQQRLASERAWMLAKPVGTEIWVGPIILPGRTPCWRCLCKRLSRNLRVHSFIRRSKAQRADVRTPEQHTPPIASAALGAVASASRAWLRKPEGHPLLGHLWSCDLETGESKLHRVVRQPSCPDCGPDQPRVSVPVDIDFRTSFGATALDTTRQTWNALKHNLDPLVGSVSTLEEVNTSDDPTRVWAASNPAARDHVDWARMKGSLRSRCVGKGMTWEQARLGALCEALERYSGVEQGSEPRVRSSANGLGRQAVHPNSCLNVSELQYEDRDLWNRHEAHSNWIPEPFDVRAELDWTPLWSLTHERTRFLPTDLLYYRIDAGARSRFFRPDSNGCAAGQSLGDAVLRGFFELVERDCVAIWWYNRLPRPVVDLTSFDQDDFCGFVDHYRARDRSVYVFDITNDFEIPAFAAVSHLAGGSPADIALGFGAHLDATTAVRRALMELGQSLVSASTVTSGTPWVGFDAPRLDPSFMEDGAESDPRDRSEYGFASLGSGQERLAKCLQRVEALGLELLVLDQTREETGLPTARVVVPGMRQHWARFRGGRLFDVPVSMGWLDEARTEDGLNPAHLYL